MSFLSMHVREDNVNPPAVWRDAQLRHTSSQGTIVSEKDTPNIMKQATELGMIYFPALSHVLMDTLEVILAYPYKSHSVVV